MTCLDRTHSADAPASRSAGAMKVMSRLQKLVVLLLLITFTGGILHAFATVGTRLVSVFRYPDTTKKRTRPGKAKPLNLKGMKKGNCMMWVNTAGCTPSGRPEPDNYGACRQTIAQGRSGYCQVIRLASGSISFAPAVTPAPSSALNPAPPSSNTAAKASWLHRLLRPLT